jgi:hypothetical protein
MKVFEALLKIAKTIFILAAAFAVTMIGFSILDNLL